MQDSKHLDHVGVFVANLDAISGLLSIACDGHIAALHFVSSSRPVQYCERQTSAGEKSIDAVRTPTAAHHRPRAGGDRGHADEVAARPHAAYQGDLRIRLHVHRGGPRRSRLLAELQTAEALASRRHEVIDTLTDIMVGQARDLLGAGARADDTIKLTVLTVISGLLELAAQWYRNQIEVDRSQLIDFATALVVTTTDITGALERQLSQAGTDHTDE